MKYILSNSNENYNFYNIYNKKGVLKYRDSAKLGSKKNIRLMALIEEQKITSNLNNKMTIFLFENYNTGEPEININKRNENDIFFNRFMKDKNNKSKIRHIMTVDNKNQLFINVVNFILKLNTAIKDKTDEDEAAADLQNYIIFNIAKLTEWFLKYPVYINYNGSLSIIDFLTPSIFTTDNKKLYEPAGIEEHYKTARQFISSYNLRGTPKINIFTNYDLNNNDENINCVKFHIIKTYSGPKKISINTINKLFEDDEKINIQSIIDFTAKYKIQLILYNNDKLIYKNNLPAHKKYKRFIGVCCNNHLYTLKDDIIKTSQYKPVLNTNINEFIEDKKNDSKYIKFIKNDLTEYTAEGKKEIKNNFNDSKKAALIFDKSFIKGISPNYTHIEDITRITSLNFINENIKDYKNLIEYDITKAFYNVAYNIIDGSACCPVFSTVSIWQPYNQEPIDIYNYYLLNIEGLEKVFIYGQTNNNLTGYILELFINQGIINTSNIEYVKNYESLILWQTIIERIKKLEQNENIKMNYLFYNGLLGQDRKETKKGFIGLDASEVKFLNADYEKNEYNDNWQIMENENNEQYIFSSKTENKILNTRNIYDFVISNTNLFMLKFIFDVKKDYKNINILKIRVDGVIFDKKINIENYEYSHYFHIEDEPFIKHQPERKIYFNGFEIIENIKKSLSIFNNNIVYVGQAGTGKTYTIKKMNTYNIGSTVANLALLNIKDDQPDKQYKTVYRLLSLFNPDIMKKTFNSLKNKIIWFDEFGLINNNMWSLIYELAKNYGVKLILTGDIGQLEPVKGDKINENLLFFNMLLKNKIELLKDYRNDEETIKTRNEILTGDYSHISESKKSFLDVKRHLCYTNKARHIINYKIMTHNNYEYNFNNNIYTISENVILYVIETNHDKKFYKNDIWRIIENKKDTHILKSELRPNEELTILNNDFKYFRVGFAGTVHSSQGQTIKDNYAIHQIKKMKFRGPSLYYTALTRATSYKNILNYWKEPQQEETTHFNNYLFLQTGVKNINLVYEDEQDKTTAPQKIKFNLADTTPEPTEQEIKKLIEQYEHNENKFNKKILSNLDDNTE